MWRLLRSISQVSRHVSNLASLVGLHVGIGLGNLVPSVRNPNCDGLAKSIFDLEAGSKVDTYVKLPGLHFTHDKIW